MKNLDSIYDNSVKTNVKIQEVVGALATLINQTDFVFPPREELLGQLRTIRENALQALDLGRATRFKTSKAIEEGRYDMNPIDIQKTLQILNMETVKNRELRYEVDGLNKTIVQLKEEITRLKDALALERINAEEERELHYNRLEEVSRKVRDGVGLIPWPNAMKRVLNELSDKLVEEVATKSSHKHDTGEIDKSRQIEIDRLRVALVAQEAELKLQKETNDQLREARDNAESTYVSEVDWLKGCLKDKDEELEKVSRFRLLSVEAQIAQIHNQLAQEFQTEVKKVFDKWETLRKTT